MSSSSIANNNVQFKGMLLYFLIRSRESRRTLRPPWYRASSVESDHPLRTLHNEVLDLCDLLLPTPEEKLKT